MNKALRALLARKAQAVAAAKALNVAAEKEGRELTAEEAKAFDEHLAAAAELDPQIARQQALIEAERNAVPLEVPDGSRIEAGPLAIEQDPRRGFRSLGEYCTALMRASTHRAVDERLAMMAALPGSYGSEGVGADGGYAVPPEFAREISTLSLEQDALLPYCDNVPVSGNNMAFPNDETTPWGTDGVRAYWEGEADAAAATKPKLGDNTIRLHKLAALVPVTEELLEDAPAMGSYVARKAAEKIDFKISNAIVRGNGVGQPLGFLNSGALVTQAAESGQTADTIVAANVLKMFSCMPIQSRQTAVWLIHPDAEPQLPLMTVGQMPVYMPPGGLSNSQYGMLLGRPVIPHQVCETVGDVGDIMLVDFSQYLALVKAGGVKSQTSIHLWFDQDLTAFKFTLRMGGQPWWNSTVAARDGSQVSSPFVALAAR